MSNIFNNVTNRKTYRIWRVLLISLAITAGTIILGSLVMYLWNAILPAVLGIHTITFWQAVGILILSKILFGGHHGFYNHSRRHDHAKHLREKWMQLTPEEREKMRIRFRDRCWDISEPHAKPE